jgi:hypothetical protein
MAQGGKEGIRGVSALNFRPLDEHAQISSGLLSITRYVELAYVH